MDHVVPSTRGHIGSIVLGSSPNVALNLHRVKERFTSSARPREASELQREERARPTPLQAESGVICLTANTTINLSPVRFPSPGRKWAQGDASALMTGRRDNQQKSHAKVYA